MLELRWKVENWTEYRDGLEIPYTEEPVLQYRKLTNPLELGLNQPIFTDWMDVPTEHVD